MAMACRLQVSLDSGRSYETPRFPLKASFNGDIDTGIGVDVDTDIDSDIAVAANWGTLEGLSGSL